MAWWPNPHGSPVLGYYAVNPWTGDVWDVMGCKRISSPAIQAEQRSILKRSTYPPRQRVRFCIDPGVFTCST